MNEENKYLSKETGHIPVYLDKKGSEANFMKLYNKKLEDDVWFLFAPCLKCERLVDVGFIGAHKYNHKTHIATCYLCKQEFSMEKWMKVFKEKPPIAMKKCPECENWIKAELILCLMCGWVDIEVIERYNREFQERLKMDIKNDK